MECGRQRRDTWVSAARTNKRLASNPLCDIGQINGAGEIGKAVTKMQAALTFEFNPRGSYLVSGFSTIKSYLANVAGKLLNFIAKGGERDRD